MIIDIKAKKSVIGYNEARDPIKLQICRLGDTPKTKSSDIDNINKDRHGRRLGLENSIIYLMRRLHRYICERTVQCFHDHIKGYLRKIDSDTIVSLKYARSPARADRQVLGFFNKAQVV